MSPILVRPVREQFEHDRVIRVLQQRYKRKFEVAINPGSEQNASVSVGEISMYPDLLLYAQERGRRLQATIEIETTESVNTLEAMAEWGPFSRLRVPFFLYVPANSLDTARRLCAEHQVAASEIWTYHIAVDQIRFTMVHRAPEAAAATPRTQSSSEPKPRTAQPRAGQTAKTARSSKKSGAPPRKANSKSASHARGTRRASKIARNAARKSTRKVAKAVKRH